MSLADQYAEWTLLAHLLIHPGQLDAMMASIQPAWFTDADARETFEAARQLHTGGIHDFDWDAVMYQAERRGYARHADLPGKLKHYAGVVADAEGFDNAWREHAKHISDLHKRRQLHNLALTLGHASGQMDANIGAVAAEAAAVLESVMAGNVEREPRHLSEIGVRVRERAADGGIQGLQSPWPGLDALTTGWKPGQLIVIGSRTGMGKSTFAAAVALHNRAAGVLMFSLEMDGEEIYPRMVAMHAGVDATAYQRGKLDRMSATNAEAAEAELDASRVWIDDRAKLTVPELRATARTYKAKHGLALVVVDYLGLADPLDKSVQRYEQVGEITRGLKQLARELQVPVMVPHQLGRRAETETPTLADLRESGNVEQDADQVIFISRTGQTEHGITPCAFIVAKHRAGPTGTVRMNFRRAYTRFEVADGRQV